MSNQTQGTARILPKKLVDFILRCLNQVASIFVDLKIRPNTLTIISTLAGLGAGISFFFEKPLLAGILIVICGLFDTLDGKVAVRTNQESLFGAMFDSTLDRYSEFFIYLGLFAYFRNQWALWIIFLAFLGAVMVSYTRARAEGLGFECKIGLMQRAERMGLLSLGAIVGALFKIFDPAIIAVLMIIALGSNITAIQRTLYVKKAEKLKKLKKEV